MNLAKLFRILIVIMAFLVVMYILSSVFLEGTWALKFDFAEEANIPTWYSTLLLGAVSLAAFLLFFHHRKEQGSTKHERLFWFVLAAGFLFMSFDESACMHEMIDDFLGFKWLYIYAPFAAVVFCLLAAYILIERKDRGHLRNWILLGILVYGFGGLFMELVDHVFWPLPHGFLEIENIVEEGGEMLGASMVLIGCLKELLSHYAFPDGKSGPEL